MNKAFNVFIFALVVSAIFWQAGLEIKIKNQELELKQLKAYVEKLENKVDTDYSIIINKGWNKRKMTDKEIEVIVKPIFTKMFNSNFSACEYGIECYRKGMEYQGIKELAIENDNLIKRVRTLKAQIEKMKWHKIADGDLPKVVGDYITNIGVLTYDHYGNNIYKWHTPFCEACDYCDEADADEVIAWCEIPKYTKETKEK